MILSRKTYFFSILLSFFVLISLVLPSKFNAAFIYLFCGFSLFTLLKNKSFKWKNEFVFLSILFFFFHLFHYFFDDNVSNLFFEIEKKLGFIFLPLFWLNLPVTDRSEYKEKVLSLFSYGMNLFGLFLLLFSGFTYFQFQNLDVFFYHEFVSVFNGSAIYYSLLFVISLLTLFEKLTGKFSILNLVLLCFNTLIIVLLSSKLFVFISIAMYVFYFSKMKNFKWILVLFGLIIVSSQFLFNSQNITKRYAEIELSSFFSLKKEVNSSTKFDGFTLRKELWNMGVEINQQSTKDFFFGVGPGDAQDHLNQKIIEHNLFIGIEGTKNTGFLNYNFHNQYIQTIVEIGFLGLFVLFLIFYYLFWLGFKTRNRFLVILNLIFLIGFTTESFFSRQIGIISFLGFNSMIIFSENRNTIQKNLKRGFDILFSLFVILFFLSWLMPILFIFIYLDTKSFPIFVQMRAGQHNRAFRCFKLRTMHKNKEADELPAQEDDIRITKFGGVLRKYALDELPQFFNVLIGDMSVVGPRPLMVNEEKSFNEIVPNFSSRLISKPGVSGLAQANGYKGIVNNNADIRVRYRLDKLYINKQSLWLDIKIIARTIMYLIKNNN